MRFAMLCALLLGACGDDGAATDAGTDALTDADDQHCRPVHDAGGPFVSSSLRTVWEEEPHLAADGVGNVAVGFIDVLPSHSSANGYAISHDDGVTWKRPVQIDSPGARVSSDPVLAVDSHSNFYFTWVGYLRDAMGNPSDMHVYVSKLDAATDMFMPPVEASNGAPNLNLDKPWITVDTNDDVLVTWEDSTAGNLLQLARSTDQGVTFTRSLIALAAGEFFNLAFPCLDRGVPAGTQVPIYVVTTASQHGIVIFASDDDGANWLRRPEVASDAIFHDPTCVVRGDQIWVSYDVGSESFSGSRTPSATAVRVAHSPNRGQAFDRNVTVSNGPPGTRYILSTLALAGSGALDLVYYQGVIQQPATLVRAWSTDGGQSWNNESIAQPGDFITSRGLPCFEGDYIGTTIAGSSLYIAYTDNTNGRAHTAFLRLPAH